MLARRIRSPWIWCLVALLVRVAYLGIGPGWGVQPYSDSVDYHRLAVHLAQGRGFTLGPEDQLYATTFRPPLLPMLVAPLYALFGPHHLLALLLQIVLSALAVPLAARLARETVPGEPGARTAWITAPLVALWPALIFFSGVLGTETLAILLSLAALLLAARLFARGGTLLALATGVCLGLAALARPTALPLAALLGAWLLALAPRPLARRGAETLVLALGIVFCVLPWTLRNHAVTGRWLAITSGGGNALYDSNNPIVVEDPAYRGASLSLRQVEPYASQFRGLDEVGIDSLSAVRGRSFLSQHRDLWPRMAGWKLARFFRFTRDAGGAQTAHPDPITWSWGLLAPFALVGFGFALARPRAPAAALALAVIAQTALAVVYWGSLRMRAPIEAVLVILGAATFARLWWRLAKNYSSR